MYDMGTDMNSYNLDHQVGFWQKANAENTEVGKVIFQIGKKCLLDFESDMVEAFIQPNTFRYGPSMGDIVFNIQETRWDEWKFFS